MLRIHDQTFMAEFNSIPEMDTKPCIAVPAAEDAWDVCGKSIRKLTIVYKATC